MNLIMPQHATESFKMRLTPEQKAKIKRLAERKGSTQKEAVLAAVERELAAEADKDTNAIEPQPGSFLEAASDFVGIIDDPNVPSDLSSNPKYMRDYGKD